MGGTREDVNILSNLLLLCGSGTTGCHGWVEHNRTEAKRLGLIVPRGTSVTSVPFENRWGMKTYLDDEGGTHAKPASLDIERRKSGQPIPEGETDQAMARVLLLPSPSTERPPDDGLRDNGDSVSIKGSNARCGCVCPRCESGD